MSYRNLVYKWTLEEDIEREISWLFGVFFENKFININNGLITVKKGYSWDGASPKFRVGNKLIGTPDLGLSTYYATLFHDVFYQFHDDIGSGSITRKRVDLLFKRDLLEVNFTFSNLYYIVVRSFGAINWKRSIKHI